MEALNTQNRSAVITRRGRPVALVQPLANVENLEGKAIRAAVEAGDIDLDGGDKSSTLKELREASLDDDSAT
jgi:antitoxin (DNA-binding transcriptional repressor) of toxin-antitoxin stability system